ncbi:hypothetical protein F4804DRAFT_317931, partial [Jackrogersella minutella]
MASGVLRCAKFLSSIIFLVGGVQLFRRKTILIAGALLMGSFLFGLGATLSTHPPAALGDGAGSPSAKAMMALIYLYTFSYSTSWGAIRWVYIGEIFPILIRDCGMAIGAANIWYSFGLCWLENMDDKFTRLFCHSKLRF